jgi:hypothetical protein
LPFSHYSFFDLSISKSFGLYGLYDYDGVVVALVVFVFVATRCTR